jgi:serine/threonine protein phosphatase PrpC
MAEADKDTVEIPAAPDPAGPGRSVASSSVRVDVQGLSHPGKVRPNNEDHFLVARFGRTMQTLLTNLPPGEVPEQSSETVYGMAVADGMGGEAAGEVASRTALRTMIDLVLQTPDWILRLDAQLIREVERRMEHRFRLIHDTLNDLARADPKLFGMGTTMTLAVSVGADLLVTHVGDSRAYLFRGDELTRLTRDQTLAQELADAGGIRPDEVSTHPLRNRLTGAISTKLGDVRAELSSFTLADGDQLLLCTDGLTDMVPEPLVSNILKANNGAQAACDQLVAAALEAGGKDNVTLVLAKYAWKL